VQIVVSFVILNLVVSGILLLIYSFYLIISFYIAK